MDLVKVLSGGVATVAAAVALYCGTNSDFPTEKKYVIGLPFALISSVGVYVILTRSQRRTDPVEMQPRQSPDDDDSSHQSVNTTWIYHDRSDRRQVHIHYHGPQPPPNNPPARR